MPERRDRVRVATRYGQCEISWECRAALLAELRELDSGGPVVRAFEDGDAGRPVELDLDGKAVLVEAIAAVAREAGGVHKLRSGVRELLHALTDELEREHIG